MFLDVENYHALCKVVFNYRITWVVHLASILSATGERNPQLAMRLNTRGIEHVLECARTYSLRVFSPSTIAVFGPSTPRDNTQDLTIMRPTTMYGVTKVYLELLGEYYHKKFGVDFRSLRYPGIISHMAMPGGGTTDYAVEIYHEAIKTGKYTVRHIVSYHLVSSCHIICRPSDSLCGWFGLVFFEIRYAYANALYAGLFAGFTAAVGV